MPFLIAAVVVVGLLCTLDLLLTVGVIKRLREHTELLTRMGGGPASIAVGEEVGAFDTSTVDGESLSREVMTAETLVGFFSPTCQPCKEKLPKFVEFARSMPGGRGQVLATVIGAPEEATALTDMLRPVARVVVEGPTGPLSNAFKTKAYPTVLMVSSTGGRLVVKADHVELDQPAPRG
ncbi:TlpA family protein disulfide reductase [Rugosimonospora africana]|uniref:TlpA family protein n=1 Tax=Rugosimonospora africana TaxID=556532 RepID=A0A8J3QU97_9ACTN|nr:hypothetical protein [Rugosimonospora africana]GIH16606.1 TlpA family protein [Rugosimonospora africana]